MVTTQLYTLMEKGRGAKSLWKDEHDTANWEKYRQL
jgi:hypothetical protein